MSELIQSVPQAPESLTTLESRSRFIDLCEEKIHQKRLTPEMLEAIKGYCFTLQISHIAERQMREHPSQIHPWYDVYQMCVNRELEYSEIIGLTPLDRKNLGLL